MSKIDVIQMVLITTLFFSVMSLAMANFHQHKVNEGLRVWIKRVDDRQPSP
jgi:hypothetical protein